MEGFDEAGNALPLNTPGDALRDLQTKQVLAEHERLVAEQQGIQAQYAANAYMENAGAANEALPPKPTVCRMVLFHTTDHDQKVYAQPAVLPAVVTFVNPDGSVNLTIFSDSHDNSYQKNVMQGPAPGQWDWPQY